ncbi:hypothetical protein DPMN_118300 [Dreissena polymorpha]|uniref:Uncharacterized protein n=1 Tax=Dreissena polymorpha TaxID=45954 RepID=A0A9D4GH48_DREPO|nr:hypothetical protein DPMN_118300 [Dreissena polymorpha]
MYSPSGRNNDDDIPEEFRRPKRNKERGLGAQDKDNTALRGGNKNPREEMAKLQSIAVYAAAMGGVNDSAGL